MAILLPNPKPQFFDAAGVPLSGGKVFTYEAGTLTPKNTYADADQTVANANPVILNARGEAVIFWDGSYKVTIKDSDDNTIYTVDDITTVVDLGDIVYDGDTISDILAITPHGVDNIVDLKAIDKTKYTVCEVLGYYAQNDGGGGLYWYDSGDTTSTDNGGTIIVATDGARWKLQTFGQPVSVLQFGAKPDGVTDASSKISDALVSLGATGGVVTAKGAFYIGTDLTIPDGCTLKGFSNPVARDDGAYQRSNYPSSLTIAGTVSITAGDSSAIEGFLILESRVAAGGATPIPYATGVLYAAAVAGYTGTAIDCADGTTGIRLSNLMIIGFAIGVDFSGTSNSGMRLNDVLTDCTKGFDIYSLGEAGTAGVLSDCGAAAYAAMGQGFTLVQLARAGSGIEIISDGQVTDFTVLERFYTGNHNIGMDVEFCSVRNCKATGTSRGLSMENNVTVLGGEFGDQYCLYGIYVNNGCDNYFVSGVSLEGATNPIYFEAGAEYGALNNYWIIGAGTIGGDTAAILKCTTSSPRQASAPTQYTPVMKITNVTTGINYLVQTGAYVLSGNVVTGYVNLEYDNSTPQIGGVTISLPITASAVVGSGGGGTVVYATVVNPPVNQGGMVAMITPSDTVMTLYWAPDAGGTAYAAVVGGDLASGSYGVLRIKFQYMIDR